MTVLMLAPHLEFPLRMGMDIYAERLARKLSHLRGDVLLLGARTLTRYRDGAIQQQDTFENEFRSKRWAAVRTVLRGSHYYLEKFLTPAYRAQANPLLANSPESLAIASYLVTAELLKPAAARPALILTHNDEIAWFRHQRQATRNPLHQLTALCSERWARRFIGRCSANFVYLHITAEDEQGFRRLAPEHRALVVPAGVDIEPLPASFPGDGCDRLLFCGSLSVKMNTDALAFFRERFWPALISGQHPPLQVMVAGSQPTRSVQELCARCGWQLYADISDADLRQLYAQANFAILPFPYTTGAKLKLLNALAAGLPVMATQNMNTLPRQAFLPNLYSDTPADWREHLAQHRQQSLDPGARAACLRFASQYSWDSIARSMHQKLAEMGL